MAACAAPPSSFQPKIVMCDLHEHPFGDCKVREPLCPNEIAERWRRAAVTVTAIPRFAVFHQCPSGGVIPNVVNPSDFLRTVPIISDGFFLDKGYIVGSSAFLSSVFNAVLLENKMNANTDCGEVVIPITTVPNLINLKFGQLSLADTTSLPNISQVLDLLINGRTDTVGPAIDVDGTNTCATLADFFDIFISVYNGNRCPQSFVYRGYIVGADLSTGVAVFRIDRCDPWNRCLPKLEAQPFLDLANSATYGPGNPAYFLGGFSGVAPMSFASGTIVDNSVVDAGGALTYEGLYTDIVADVGVDGGPILNKCAQVVGIATGLSNTNTVFGVTSMFAKVAIDELIKAHRDPNCTNRAVYAPLLGFLVFRHASLGAAYVVLDAGEIGLLSQDFSVPSLDAKDRRYLDSQFCKENRELKGLLVTRVTGNLACAETDEVCESVALRPETGIGCKQKRTKRYRIHPGDIIQSVAGVPLGQLPGQAGLDQVLQRLCCGDIVEVLFLRKDDAYTQQYRLCVSLEDNLAWLNQLTDTPAGMLAYVSNLVPSLDLAYLLQKLSTAPFIGTLQLAYNDDELLAALAAFSIRYAYPVPYKPGLLIDYGVNMNPICRTDRFPDIMDAALAIINGAGADAIRSL